MSIYESTAALFETALDKMSDSLVKGDTPKYLEIRACLIKCYRDSLQSNERMLEEIHRLKAKLPKD